MLPTVSFETAHRTYRQHLTPDEREGMFRAQVAVSLQNPPEPEGVRSALRHAKAESLDWKGMYQSAVAARDPNWDPAPPLEEIAPPEHDPEVERLLQPLNGDRSLHPASVSSPTA